MLGAIPPDRWITQETKLKIRRLIGEPRIGRKARRCSYRIFVSSYHSCLALGLFLSWQLELVIRAIVLNLVRDRWNRLPPGSCSELCTAHHSTYGIWPNSPLLPFLYVRKVLIRIWGLPKSTWWRYRKHLCLYGNLFISTLLGEPLWKWLTYRVCDKSVSPDIARFPWVAKIALNSEPLV